MDLIFERSLVFFLFSSFNRHIISFKFYIKILTFYIKLIELSLNDDFKAVVYNTDNCSCANFVKFDITLYFSFNSEDEGSFADTEDDFDHHEDFIPSESDR